MRKPSQPFRKSDLSGAEATTTNLGATIVPPQISSAVVQNVKPTVTEAQRVAAETSVSGRRAVSRGAIFLSFYLWILSGAIMVSWIARHTEFFPGDKSITRTLQKYRNPWMRRFMAGISEIGFPKLSIPITLSIASIFWALRFRLEALFVLLTSTSGILNWIVKRIIKRPRPTSDLVTVARVINEPGFPSGHVMHYINLFGLLNYFLATNWRTGRLRNFLLTISTSFIALVGPSRVYLGAHWPSDVMAGYIYGGLWFGCLMTIYLRVKSWIHPQVGKTPAVMQPLRQPGDDD